jgi:hypothetical protein
MRDRDKFHHRTSQLLKAINLCLEQRLELPSLVLIYSTMDTMGWLYSDDPKANISHNFKRWVSRYVTTGSSLRCTPDDLWAARCALLHTFTAESKLSDKGKARRLCYAWGNASISQLHAAIDSRPGMAQKFVGVHVNELFRQLCDGMTRFLGDLDADPELASTGYERSNRFYADLSKEALGDLLRDST